MPEQANVNQFTQEEVIAFIKNLYNNELDFTPSDYVDWEKGVTDEIKNKYDNDFWDSFYERNSFLDDAMTEEEARNLIVQELKKNKNRFDPEFRTFSSYYRKQHGDDSITDNVEPFSPKHLRERPSDVDHMTLEQVNKLCDIIAAQLGKTPEVPTDEEGEAMSSADKLFEGLETLATRKEKDQWVNNQIKNLSRTWKSPKEFDMFKNRLGLSSNTTNEEASKFVRDLLTRGKIARTKGKNVGFMSFFAPQSAAKYKEGKNPSLIDYISDLAVLGLSAVPGGALASKGMMPLSFGKLAGYGRYGGKLADLAKPALGAGALAAMDEGVDYLHDVAEDFTDVGRYSRSQTRRPVKNPFKKELNPLERATNAFLAATSGAVTGGLIDIGAGALGWKARNYLRKMADELDPEEFTKRAKAYKEEMRKKGDFDFDKNNTKEVAEKSWEKYYKTEKEREKISGLADKLRKQIKNGNPLRRKSKGEKDELRKMKKKLAELEGKEEAAEITLEGLEDTLGRRYGAPLQRSVVRYIKNHPHQKEVADWLLRAAKFRNFDPNTSYTLGDLYNFLGGSLQKMFSEEDEDE